MDGGLAQPDDVQGGDRRRRVPLHRNSAVRERLPSCDVAHGRGVGPAREGKPSFIDGRPEMIAGIIPISDVEVTDSWSVTGMRATGSNDCLIEGTFAPDEAASRVVRREAPVRDRSLRAHPTADAVRAGPRGDRGQGAARGMQSRFVTMADKRPVGTMATLAERSYGQMAVGEAEGLILAAEDTLAAAVAETGVGGRAMKASTCTRGSRFACVWSLRYASPAGPPTCCTTPRACTDRSALTARARSPRDVHVVSQHVMVNVGRIEVAGRALLGLDPADHLSDLPLAGCDALLPSRCFSSLVHGRRGRIDPRRAPARRIDPCPGQFERSVAAHSADPDRPRPHPSRSTSGDRRARGHGFAALPLRRERTRAQPQRA